MGKYLSLFKHKHIASDDSIWYFGYSTEAEELERHCNTLEEPLENYEIDDSQEEGPVLSIYTPYEDNPDELDVEVMAFQAVVYGTPCYSTDEATELDRAIYDLDACTCNLFEQLTHVPDPLTSLPWWLFNIGKMLGTVMLACDSVARLYDRGEWDSDLVQRDHLNMPFEVWFLTLHQAWKEMQVAVRNLSPETCVWLDEQGLGMLMYSMNKVQKCLGTS